MLVNRINNGDELKREFQRCDRDDYCIGTYDAIVDFYDECFTEPQELDVIAICCDLSEDTYDEIVKNYSIESGLTEEEEDELDDDEKAEHIRETVLEYLNENTSVLYYNDNIVSYWAF